MQILRIVFILLLAISMQVKAQQSTLFPKGEKAANVHHVGTVYLNELSEADSVFSYSTSLATFEPGARLDWHMHPGGQILMITQGVGYYQEKGKARQTVRQGEIIKCPPGVEHWHGATPDRTFGYLATSPTQKGKTIWFKRVTDEEYGSAKE
ncbi:cupin domain-containing protein [Siphonobacter sp. SORGH_AS_0500]|uniref:cupin domain-containing protein n=1 Tax=Siphonobacter sp. SORGH_AS_0500 TaxID=1864824 RepID=UPI00286A56E2|nr:cupin domain-containing protein [Siphonobacter sp. SORGH_AS_0500]